MLLRLETLELLVEESENTKSGLFRISINNESSTQEVVSKEAVKTIKLKKAILIQRAEVNRIFTCP